MRKTHRGDDKPKGAEEDLTKKGMLKLSFNQLSSRGCKACAKGLRQQRTQQYGSREVTKGRTIRRQAEMHARTKLHRA